MSRKLKTLLMSSVMASTVTLSGCAQMLNLSDMMWTGTKNFTVKSGQKIASVLRPRAKREEPVFVFNERGEAVPQQGVETYTPTYTSDPYASPYASNGYSSQPYSYGGQDAYTSGTYSAPSSTYGASTYQSGTNYYGDASYNHNYTPGQSTGETYYYGPQSPQPVEVEQSYADNRFLPDMSYVKLSGQTSISDWQSCQAQAGGYIEPEGHGYKIRSDFDYCMRVNGYLPEREAIQYMDANTLLP